MILTLDSWTSKAVAIELAMLSMNFASDASDSGFNVSGKLSKAKVNADRREYIVAPSVLVVERALALVFSVVLPVAVSVVDRMLVLVVVVVVAVVVVLVVTVVAAVVVLVLVVDVVILLVVEVVVILVFVVVAAVTGVTGVGAGAGDGAEA